MDSFKLMAADWLKTFLSVAGALILEELATEGSFADIGWQAGVIGGLVAAGPVLFNWLNSSNPAYGKVRPELERSLA